MSNRGLRLYSFLLFVFFTLAFVPMLLLSGFNQPSPADDYCYVDTVQKYGFWQAQKFYYDGWSGRYFAYFLAHANPLLYNFPAGFKLYAVLLILFLLFSVYRLAGTLSGGFFSKRVLWGFAATFFGLYVYYVQSIAEGFFWMITSLTNTLPILMLMWLPAIMTSSTRERPLSTAQVVSASLLIFAAVGCSEIAMLVTGLLLLYTLSYLLFTKRPVKAYWWVLLIVFALSAYMEVSAPGNKVRMEGNTMSGDLLGSFVGSLRLTLATVTRWVLSTPLWIATLLFIPLAGAIARDPVKGKEGIFNIHPLLVWTGLFGLLAACFFPTYYGGLVIRGELDPPARNFNTVYLLLLAGWFYAVIVSVRFAVRKQWFLFQSSQRGILEIALAGGMLFYAVTSPNFRLMYRDLFNGTAYRYDQQIRSRYVAVKEAEGDTVRVAPLKDIPATLYIDDIRFESEHLWNRCYSGYFGKNVILDTLASPLP